MDKYKIICQALLVQMAVEHPHWQKLPLERITQIVAKLMPRGLEQQEFQRIINLFELSTDIKLP